MKIQYSFYSLKLRPGLHSVRSHSTRHGALLRITFDDGCIGYADCHPWTENGDKPLIDQLDLLKKRIHTSLTARSLHFARLDADARSRGQNLFSKLHIPRSHFFLPSPYSYTLHEAEGFSCFKLKLSGAKEEILPLKKLLEHLQKRNCTLRLDFNQKCSVEQFQYLLSEIKQYHALIDFCEDPFPFQKKLWETTQQHGVSLACDALSHHAIGLSSAANVLVIKPAIQSENDFLKAPQRLVVTSYLDHPLGQLCAAYSAAVLNSKVPKNVDVCGLLSHRIYEKNAFSEQLSWNGNAFTVPAGTGFGYDDLLASQHWVPL